MDALALNTTGEWLAIALGELGQLLVWEWKSLSSDLQTAILATLFIGFSIDSLQSPLND